MTEITRIEVRGDDVTFYFAGSLEPWNVGEFEKDSPTRFYLEDIEDSIIEFNYDRAGW